MSDPGGSRSPIGYQIGIRVATILDRFALSMLLNYMTFFTLMKAKPETLLGLLKWRGRSHQ